MNAASMNPLKFAFVLDLPPEVLGLIFLECLPKHGNPELSLELAPLLLTTVCRDWRAVAERTPQLWVRLEVNFLIMSRRSLISGTTPELAYEIRLKSKADAIVRWLTNAGPFKTTLSFTSVIELAQVRLNQRDRILNEVIPSILDRICAPQFSNMWKSLTLTRMDSRFLPHIFAIPAGNFRSLKYLACSSAIGDGSSSTLLSRSGVISAPSLTSLQIDRLALGEPFKDLPLANWSSLRELNLSHIITGRDLFLVVARCARTLRCLSVADVMSTAGGVEGRSAHYDTIDLPVLDTLSIHEHGWEEFSSPHLGPQLCSLRTPSLKSLSFESSCHFDDHLPRTVLAFVRTIAPTGGLANLRHLEIEYNNLRPSELVPFMEIVGGEGTRLQELNLRAGYVTYQDLVDNSPPHATFDTDVLRRWSGQLPPGRNSEATLATTPFLFPWLERLTCRLARDDEFSDQDLMEFLAHRLRAQAYIGQTGSLVKARLSFVKVLFVSKKTLDVYAQLKEAVGDIWGLEMSLEYDTRCLWVEV